MEERSITPGIFVLTAVCGVIDATCYLALGGVFSNIMTGNLMFLAFALGQGQGFEAVPYFLVPLVAFSLGAVCCGSLLRTPRLGGGRRHAVLHVAVLVAVAFVLAIIWQPQARSTESMVIVGILALAMGMQNAAVFYHPVPDVATNVMTLTLVRLLSNWSLVGGDNARWHFRVGSLTIFFVSAAVGAALLRFGPAAGLGLALIHYLVALPFLLKGRSPADAT